MGEGVLFAMIKTSLLEYFYYVTKFAGGNYIIKFVG